MNLERVPPPAPRKRLLFPPLLSTSPALRLCLFLLALGFAAHAAPKPGSATAVPLHWTAGVYNIGNLVPFEIRVPISSKEFYLEGEFAEQTDWGQARIAKVSQILPPSLPGTLTLKGYVQFFATGTVALPLRTLVVHTASGVQPYSVKADLIRITPLLPADAKRPAIAAPMALPKPFPWVWVLGVLAAVALLAAAVFLLIRRARARAAAPKYVPDLKMTDPDRWLREETEKLFKAPIEPSLRYQRLSHTLREYMAIRFQRPFLEWTTSEIRRGVGQLDELRDVPLTDLLNLLSMCDYVMFARYRPQPVEEKDAREIVMEFLDNLVKSGALEVAS